MQDLSVPKFERVRDNWKSNSIHPVNFISTLTLNKTSGQSSEALKKFYRENSVTLLTDKLWHN